LLTAGEGALSETIATVSLSTVPRLCLLSAAVRFASGEADVPDVRRAGDRADGIAADWTDLAVRSLFTFTQGSNNAAKVRGSFQETAPRKTTEHTVKHRDGSVGSVAVKVRWS